DARDDRARRIPPAGARPAFHVAGIPEEMSMRSREISYGIRTVAAASPLRLAGRGWGRGSRRLENHPATPHPSPPPQGGRERAPRANQPANLSRRAALQSVCVSFAAAMAPWPTSAAGARDPRFVVIILRGAMDGLAAVAPIGDPDYASLRGPLALASQGERAGLPLDGFFVLHPAMPNLARLYGEKRALLVHATATAYRERSHFDGQDVLESGYPGPGRTESGWLNRAVALLPSAGGEKRRALSVGVTAPLVMRGPAPV